jgi:hypothetical protein
MDVDTPEEDINMFKIFSFGMRFCFILTTVVIAILVLSLPALAQVGGPCAETITKYCKDVIPGDGRVMKCLNDHRDDQSIACKDWIEDQQKRLKGLNEACYEEISVLCKNYPPEGVLIFQCLLSSYSALKLDCREKIREIKEHLQ